MLHATIQLLPGAIQANRSSVKNSAQFISKGGPVVDVFLVVEELYIRYDICIEDDIFQLESTVPAA